MDTVGDVERRFTSIFVSLEVPDVLALFVCLLMKPLTLSIEAPALFKDAVMVRVFVGLKPMGLRKANSQGESSSQLFGVHH